MAWLYQYIPQTSPAPLTRMARFSDDGPDCAGLGCWCSDIGVEQAPPPTSDPAVTCDGPEWFADENCWMPCASHEDARDCPYPY